MCVCDGSRHIPIVCGGVIFVTEIKNPDIALDNIGIFMERVMLNEDSATASAGKLLRYDDLLFDLCFQLRNVGDDTDQSVALGQIL